MLYLSGAVSVALDQKLPPMAGWMLQPAMGNHPIGGRPWAADNGCFGKGDAFNANRWLAWLAARREYLPTCLWAVVPDVVGDSVATLRRFDEYSQAVRDYGYSLALVAQDGLTVSAVPWHQFDCLFIGGSTQWKLSETAWNLVREAKNHGKGAHVGRVNSERRYRACYLSGVDSVDGTYLAFAPDQNSKKLQSWATTLDRQSSFQL